MEKERPKSVDHNLHTSLSRESVRGSWEKSTRELRKNVIKGNKREEERHALKGKIKGLITCFFT